MEIQTTGAAAARYQSALAEVPEILELVADACDVPMVALKVADGPTAHFAATLGIPTAVDVPSSVSLCRMVSAADDTMVVGDAIRDPRVATHPLVAGETHVRYLAAAPLHHGSQIVGALCVFDTARRDDAGAATSRLLARLARRVDTETGLRDQLQLWNSVGRDDVVSTISHEIRTPLASIQGNLELLGSDPEAVAAPYRSRIETVQRNAARLCRTVDHLLRAVDQNRCAPVGERRLIDLSELADEFASARVRLELPGRPVLAVGDLRLIRTVIANLLDNALSVTKGGAAVTMRVGPGPSIEIHDDGPGLSPDELALLGTPFFRSRRARDREAPGLGLGLSISRQIVEAQGGHLQFHSEPGVGTTARITLPAAPSST